VAGPVRQERAEGSSCKDGPYRVPSSRGLGHHPLKVETRVRTPLGLLSRRGCLRRSGALERCDLLELVDETISLHLEVVAPLEIHPESLRRAEVARHA
jgi:hypothetical protein